MCGICGVYAYRPADPRYLRDAVARMVATLAHRGPDDEGIWVDPDGCAVLGNRRLAIIDLSAAGHQPMTDRDEDIVLTYNGEIYNYKELRRDLEAAGFAFRSQTDTEVILTLYQREGPEFVRRLRGMFALAIWDRRTRRLTLARDRFGIKPLYYSRHNGMWVFASEIRAIRASRLVDTPVNPLALAAFLRLGSIPGPMTAFEGVRELPPGALLIVSDAGDGTLNRYWEVPAPALRVVNPKGAPSELRTLLLDSVRRHLMSDVPIGVFLSGGVDSAALVALMREIGHSKIRTLSIAFPEKEFDESGDAARIASRYETQHVVLEVRGEDVARDLKGIIASMDQPTIDGINTYYVSRLARWSGTTVALSGLGGDELFCGYASFRYVPRVLFFQRAVLGIPVGRPLLCAMLAGFRSQRAARLRESLTCPPTVYSAYLAVRGLLARSELMAITRPGPLQDAVREFDPVSTLAAFAPPLPEDPVAATGVLELRAYLHNQLLRDTDVMSMTHGIEVRVPYLDHPLVEFAMTLPAGLRFDGKPRKWILIEALRDILPPDVGGIKRGFTFPLGQWMRGPLSTLVNEVLGRGVKPFSPSAVAALRERVNQGRSHWSCLWALVVLSLWLMQVAKQEDL